MCEAKPGPRCAADTCPTLEAATQTYTEAHPSGPDVQPLASAAATFGSRHAPTLGGAPVGLRSFPAGLWHVGSLNPADKKSASYEGVGLSVSEHPDEWERIARLGGGRRFLLARDANTFVDYHALTATQREAITAWGLSKGYIEPATAYRVSYEDEETEETVTMLLDSRDEAEVEAEERWGEVTEVATFATTATFPDPTVRVGSLNEHDILTTVWVGQNTDLDGVWWEDRYDPDNYSCPRGVILPHKLSAWSTETADV